MSFDTERFIAEIEKYPCLWNINNEEYSNKELKLSTWNEIAEILFDDWEDIDESLQTKRVQDMQKKWKGLRDYHNREKHKDPPLKSGSKARRKRKAPFLNMLKFLNATKKRKRNPTGGQTGQFTEVNPTFQNVVLHEETVPEESQSSGKTKKMSVFQEALIKSMEKKREDDPDMNFLLNILPEMKTMTPSQNFDFRFEVMKIIKNIKYNKKNSFCTSYFTEEAGCSYPYQYGYTDGIGISSAQNSPSNSNKSEATSIQDSPSHNSRASSVEDVKVMLQSADDDDTE